MDKLNNINLTHLIEFFTFPLNRFLSGVVTGTEYSQKFDFIKQLIRDAEGEYSGEDSQPVFAILDCNDENYSHYLSEFDLCQDILRKILEQLPGETKGKDCKTHIIDIKRNILIVFNKFDIINKDYRDQISQLIETLFDTTEDGSTVKINMLFLVEGNLNIFDYFTEETSIKVSSMKLPIYNFDFIST